MISMLEQERDQLVGLANETIKMTNIFIMDTEGNDASYASDVADLPIEHKVVAGQPDWSTDDYVAGAGQEEQHKGSQDDFVATASSMPFSIEPDQSTDRDQAALVTNQSGTKAQTDWSTDNYVAEAGQEK